MPAINGVHTTPSPSEPRPYLVLVTGFGVSPPYPVVSFIASIWPAPDLLGPAILALCRQSFLAGRAAPP